MKTYESKNMMSHLEILLPDNTVMLRDGTRMKAEGRLSFEKESELGWHLSDIEEALTDEISFILRHYVPIVKDGRTEAMLYGVISLRDLPDLWEADAYDGKPPYM